MRSPARGADLQNLIDVEGLDAEIVMLDVTDDASVRGAVGAVLDREGRLDAVVNNAGVGPFAPLERTDDQHWLSTLDTNLLGPVRVARAALPSMRSQGSGTIVNISSVAGRMAAIPTQGAYAASKHAVCAVTDSLVAECAPFGVNSYCIEPGFFATAIMDKDTVARLPDDDPYRPAAAQIEQFFRTAVAAAPPPDAVAEIVAAAIGGTLTGGVHHPVGVPGLNPTPNAGRG